MPSARLGVWEARITGPQDQDCSIVLHMTGSRYRVMTPRNMTCYSAEGASYSRTNQGGDTFRLGGGAVLLHQMPVSRTQGI